MTQSNDDNRTILVIGATGQQGSATVNALLGAGGWNVRALTRNADSDKAKALAARSAQVLQGDMTDPASLDRAMEGAYGVFSIQVVMGEDSDRIEREQGANVVEAAKKAGVSHIVHSSAAGTGRRDTPGPKEAVEQLIKDSGIRYTMLRPTSFMENFNRGKARIIETSSVSQALPPHIHQDYISVIDIGRAAAIAFSRPDDFAYQIVDLSGDRLSQLEIADVFSRVLGKTVTYAEMSRDRLAPFYQNFMGWIEKNDGYGVELPDAIKKRWDIDLMTLEDWLRSEGWG